MMEKQGWGVASETKKGLLCVPARSHHRHVMERPTRPLRRTPASDPDRTLGGASCQCGAERGTM